MVMLAITIAVFLPLVLITAWQQRRAEAKVQSPPVAEASLARSADRPYAFRRSGSASSHPRSPSSSSSPSARCSSLRRSRDRRHVAQVDRIRSAQGDIRAAVVVNFDAGSPPESCSGTVLAGVRSAFSTRSASFSTFSPSRSSSVTGYALALWNVRWARHTYLFVPLLCAFVPFNHHGAVDPNHGFLMSTALSACRGDARRARHAGS